MGLFQGIKNIMYKYNFSDNSEEAKWYFENKLLKKTIIQLYRTVELAAFDRKLSLSAVEIEPFEISFKKNYSEVKELIGTPSYEYKYVSNNQTIKVLFYRNHFHFPNALAQLQFLEDQWFFADVEIGRLHLSTEEREKAAKKIFQEYINATHYNLDSMPIVHDLNNNFVIINNDVKLHVAFLNGAFAYEKSLQLEKVLL